MKQVLLMIAVVALVGCGTTPKYLSIDISTGELILTKGDLDLKSAVLSFSHLTEIPKGLEKLTQLESLWLFNNQLTDVKGLEKLAQLKELSLTGNKLTNVKGLEKLTQLTILGLDYNQLTELPKGLEKLTKLTVLYLGYNQLTDVKGLGEAYAVKDAASRWQ